jgi:molecular chaperone DnaK (HSP70)
MSDHAIDFGIDLGEERASIAVYRDDLVEVIKNEEGREHTPCVIWIDRRGNARTGSLAVERLAIDPQNCASNLRSRLGTPYQFTFERIRQILSAEEVCAEILERLKKDAVRAGYKAPSSAVFSLPSTFHPEQRDSLCAAANLA